MSSQNVFISYKRADGMMLAKYFRVMLSGMGYSVFLDIDEMRAGYFDDQIRQAIADCTDFVCILSPSAAAQLTEGGEGWVPREIACALEGGKTVIPVLVDDVRMPSPESMPERIRKFAFCEAVVYNRQNNDKMEDAFFSHLHSLLSSEPERESYLRHVTHSGYSSTYRREARRLSVQERYSREVDAEAFGYILSRLPTKTPVGLDIGCADGAVTRLRFLPEYGFSRVIGVDKNEEGVARAENDGLFGFYCADAEAEGFSARLREILDENGVGGVDFVYCALSLHHMTRPLDVLKKIKAFMNPGAGILLRGVDDGTVITYDDGGVADKSIALSLQTPNMSDRFFGRKFYSLLVDAGFRDMRAFFSTDSTVGMDFDDRQLFFDYYFRFRRNYTEKLVRQNPSDPKFTQLDREMSATLMRLQDAFEDDRFFAMTTTIDVLGFC